MEDKDRAGERTFKVTFNDEGAAKLGDQLTQKLKEYMGEFVDDTLVKYVIVLLGNGRSKEEVKEDLDVFLGDNTDAFVTWLWDHLASHLDQYIPSQKSSAVEVAKPKPESVDLVDKNDPYPVSDSGGGKSHKSSKSRHNRDWKGLVMEDTQPPPLRSSITDNVRKEEKSHRSALQSRQSVSPEHHAHRKRDRPDERHEVKKEVSAPRRLLQFAVRDAVATTKPSNSVIEPERKRLRSVVATSTTMSSEEVHHRRIRSVARLANPMATAIRAVAEAAEDVRKVRTGNVFDRLSRGADAHEGIEQIPMFRGPAGEDDEYENYEQIDEKRQRHLHTRGYVGGYNVNASMIDSSIGMASDSASDNEGYGDVSVMERRDMNGTETGMSMGYKVDNSYMMRSGVPQDVDELAHRTRKKENEQPVSVPNTKHKIVNISVNVNTWKPPHYQPRREFLEVETRKSMQETEIGVSNSNVRAMKENSNPVTVLGNGKSAGDVQKECQQTVASSVPDAYSTRRPLEDADSRTVFVNNVHFAATKDSLSRHFNKFGEVLKVIILTDAATGHPKGSAYVEFMRKEAAENALSLDGTSFMSRIIKVVKKSAGQQEATSPTMTWPRIARGSPFAVPRFTQAPFPRVFPGGYRARPPIKPGARSMQWKRDAQQTPSESVASASGNPGNVPSTSRGLTYVRTESKSDGNPGGGA